MTKISKLFLCNTPPGNRQVSGKNITIFTYHWLSSTNSQTTDYQMNVLFCDETQIYTGQRDGTRTLVGWNTFRNIKLTKRQISSNWWNGARSQWKEQGSWMINRINTVMEIDILETFLSPSVLSRFADDNLFVFMMVPLSD